MQSTYASTNGPGPSHAGGASVPVGRSRPGLGLTMDDMTGNGAGLGVFDQELTFDESMFDNVNGLAPLPFPPSFDLDNFNTFEDPFAYSARPVYDAPAQNEHFTDESPEQDEDVDNKLLGFSAPIVTAQIFDGTGAYAEANMTAELLGMFFVAEDVFGAENNPTARPLELTCYRRNLWQCSGQIILPRHITRMINEHGQPLPMFELAASISAKESIEGKPTEIISIPWKSSSEESAKSPAAPPRVPLDLSAGQELDNNRTSLPVSWKRLQFKHATANNGRRKGLQQHYVVQINLLSKLENGEYVKIAEIQSGPVIVRGRSPRNFDGRKDVSVAPGDKKVERRATLPAATPETPAPVPKTEPGVDMSQTLHRFSSLPEGNLQQPEWTPSPSYTHASPHPAKRLMVSPNPSRPPVPAWSSDTSMKATTASSNSATVAVAAAAAAAGSCTPRNTTLPRPPGASSSLPINLSLSEDENSPNRSKSDSISPHFSKNFGGGGTSQQAQSQSQQSGAVGDDDDEEQLYEYFPLSLDDWMAPVDAVYRPHVVHHTIVPPELKAQQARSKTKRYFSSD